MLENIRSPITSGTCVVEKVKSQEFPLSSLWVCPIDFSQVILLMSSNSLFWSLLRIPWPLSSFGNGVERVTLPLPSEWTLDHPWHRNPFPRTLLAIGNNLLVWTSGYPPLTSLYAWSFSEVIRRPSKVTNLGASPVVRAITSVVLLVLPPFT